MKHYCTLFDTFYMSRGLVMYESLIRTGADFHLYIFAFDDSCYSILKRMSLEKATIISLKEFEDDDLLRVKPGRSKAEYCWTSTPSTIKYVIENFNVPECTYLDADLFFYQDPKILLDEMGNNSILITLHRYPPRFNRSVKSGIYCVQFITFKNNLEGLKVLNWWRDACIEWCYNRYEDGKFGDQKYLDDWTTRFKGVHVLQNLGGGLASWNVEQWPLKSGNGNEIIFHDLINKNDFSAIFYHFHHVRFFQNDLVDLGWRHPTLPVVKKLYAPYIIQLGQMDEKIKLVSGDYKLNLQPFSIINDKGIKNKLKFFYKSFFRFNVFNVKKLISEYSGSL